MNWIKKFISHFLALASLQRFVVLLIVFFSTLFLPPVFEIFIPTNLSTKESLAFVFVSAIFLLLGIGFAYKNFSNREVCLLLVVSIGSVMLLNLAANKLFEQTDDDILRNAAFSQSESFLMAKDYERCINWEPPKYKKLYTVNSPSIQCKGFSSTDYGNGFTLRTTWSAEYLPIEDVKEIWFFGGSTTFSRYTSDSNTIPSVVARELYNKNIKARVVNFGMSGLNHAYELNNLITALREFPSRPDLVVFYDGYNDSITSVAYGGDHVNLAFVNGFFHSFKNHERLFFDLNEVISEYSYVYRRLWSLIKYGKFGLTSDFSIDEAVSHYTKAVEISDIVLEGLSVKRLYLLQPMTFTRKNKNSVEVNYEGAWGEVGRTVYKGILAGQKDNPYFYDISNVFDDNSEQLFYDIGHLGDKGNLLVGEKIAELITAEFGRQR